MDDMPNTLDALTVQVRDLRTKGYSFEEISTKIGVSTEEVVLCWKEFTTSMTQMSPEEQSILQMLRLENLLVKCNDRLKYADKAEDYELVIKLLKEVAALQGINKDMQKDVSDRLVQITQAQTALILQAFFTISGGLKLHIEDVFSRHKTIKAIRGELLSESFNNVFTTEAQRVLTQGVEE